MSTSKLDRLTTLSTHHQRVDSDNSQSVISTDHQHGNITVTAGMYNLSNGERFVTYQQQYSATCYTLIDQQSVLLILY